MLKHLFAAITLAALPLPAGPALQISTARAQASETQPAREIEIIVEGGYRPNRIEIRAGERVRLKFLRKEHDACTKEVVIAALGIRRELPPNEPVLVDLPALQPGVYEMKCGMNMIRGTLVVTAPAHH